MAYAHEHTQDLIRGGGGVSRQVPAASGASSSQHRWFFWVGLTLLAVLIGAGLVAGGFFVGQGTRPTRAELNRHVAVQAARDRAFFGTKMTTALSAQHAHLMSVMHAKVKHASQTGYANGESAGYSSGQQQGYSSGQATGLQQGKQQGKRQGKKAGQQQGLAQGYSQGFNDGTCYDPVTFDYVC